MSKQIKVTIWNEFRHEKGNPSIMELYPGGMHATIKRALEAKDSSLIVRLAALDDPEQGLPDEVLNDTDVLLWWGHGYHEEVSDELVEKIKDRVFRHGMGFIPLHSSHMSKPFKAIVATNGILSWGDNQQEVVWNVKPSHPIAAGIPEHFVLDEEEMYGEPFYIPEPDELVFMSWYKNGNVFRSGACFTRGLGRIFYFQPGHETCPSYNNPYVQQIIYNAVKWAAPTELGIPTPPECTYRTPVV